MRLAAVILAAGGSRRLGHPKQLVTLGGERLLERAVRIAREAGCEPFVVLGASAKEIRDRCHLDGCTVIQNDGWADGLATSIRAGVLAVSGIADAAVLMTCDQPAVTPEHLRRLAAVNSTEPIASAYANRRGIPAYFPAHYFHQLTQLSGDGGAKELLRQAATVELSGGELDIDTEQGLLQSIEWLKLKLTP